jgi:translocation and assembly module TamB
VVVSPETWTSGNDEGPSSRPSLMIDIAANIRFARGVQVFFPSTTFPMVAGYSDPSSSLAIRYDQATSDFSLKGTVTLRGGEVFYVQRNFFLKSGKIVFNEGTDRFEPRVTLLAELRDRNENGPVRITLKADNAPITSFKPALSSDPIMSEAQIASLMGQNIFGTEGEKGLDFRTTAISASEFIPQLNVSRVLENKIRDAAGLDIFYLRTQVLQNWLIDMSQTKADNNANPLARYFDRTSIYLGKYLDDSIFTYGSMGLRESTPLVGSTTSIINYELGVELDAPFGRITWALAPEDWKTLTFRDQSLSLSWKLSY